MGSISIKRNGSMRNFDLSYLDWAKAQAANTANSGNTDIGDLIFTRENCLCEGTLNTSNIPEGATNKFYIFKSNNFPNSLIQGYTPKDEQRGGRVLYFGAFQEYGDNINDFFPEAPADDRPPSNYTIDVTNPEEFKWWGRLGNASSYYGPVYKTGNNVPEIYLNYNALGYFETMAGCTFGASMDMLGGNNFGVTAGIQIHSYGPYQYLNDNAGRTPTLTGNQAYGGKPWGPQYDGQQIIPYPSNEVAYNAYTRSLRDWSIFADDVAIADIGDDITAEFVATAIDNVLYAGLAACRWEGNHIAEIQVTLLPAWFWGRESMELDWDFDTPDIDDSWFGPTVQPDAGADGSYQYTQLPANDNSLPAENIYSHMTNGIGGTRVYMCNSGAITDIIRCFWEDNDLSDKEKTRMNQGIIAVHQLPHPLVGTQYGSDMSYLSLADKSVKLSSGSMARIINPLNSGTLGTFSNGLAAILDCYLDYEPYTTVSLFLPFAGTIQIPASQCIGGSITVKYYGDCTTGDIVYEIKCVAGKRVKDANGSPLVNHYYVSGNCAIQIPITGITNGFQQRLSSTLGAVGSGLSVAAGVALTIAGDPVHGIPLAAGGAAGFWASSYSALEPNKTIITGGALGGSLSGIGQKQVILKVTRPKKAYDKNWLVLGGIRSELDATLDKFSTEYSTTMTRVKFVNVNTINATNTEKDEIQKLLMGGVYL